MLFCSLQLVSPTLYYLLWWCVFAVLHVQMVVPSRFHKQHGRFFFFGGAGPPSSAHLGVLAYLGQVMPPPL